MISAISGLCHNSGVDGHFGAKSAKYQAVPPRVAIVYFARAALVFCRCTRPMDIGFAAAGQWHIREALRAAQDAISDISPPCRAALGHAKPAGRRARLTAPMTSPPMRALDSQHVAAATLYFRRHGRAFAPGLPSSPSASTGEAASSAVVLARHAAWSIIGPRGYRRLRRPPARQGADVGARLSSADDDHQPSHTARVSHHSFFDEAAFAQHAAIAAFSASPARNAVFLSRHAQARHRRVHDWRRRRCRVRLSAPDISPMPKRPPVISGIIRCRGHTRDIISTIYQLRFSPLDKPRDDSHFEQARAFYFRQVFRPPCAPRCFAILPLPLAKHTRV